MTDTLVRRERVSALPAANGAKPLPAMALANIEAEQAVLGAVLLDPSLHPNVAEILQPADFTILFNGFVWYAFDKLMERNVGIDLISVSDELEKVKDLKGVDFATRLTDLMAACPDPMHAEHYARKVRDAATLIRVHRAAAKMQALVEDKARDSTVDELIDECNKVLFLATDQNTSNKDTRADAIISRYFDMVESGMSGKVPPGVPSGFQELDVLIPGFARGEVTVIGGGEGMGKTSWLLTVIRAVSKQYGLTVAHFSLEMTQDEVIRIMIAMETGIPKDALKSFSLTDLQWRQFVAATGHISAWPMHVIDEYPALTPIQLRRRLRKLIKDEPIHLVTIDGLWLMEPTDPSRDGRPRDVGNIMRDLNEIARDFDVPVLVAHQYNGEQWNRQDKRPKLIDLAESSGVRRNAQVVLGLYRDSYYGINAPVDVTELHILKDRNGRAQGRKIDLLYDFDRTMFRDVGGNR